MMPEHIAYMRRCLQLAGSAAGKVAPNPMVGAVLVHRHRIIGEGCHEYYGGPHAEVNCMRSVKEEDRQLVPASTLYVSLEPCAHFGKTPPCADLIIREGIQRVIVGCRDPFPSVNGKGIEKLEKAGVQVEISGIEEECRELNKRFFTFHTCHQPYVILKWAQTNDGFIGSNGKERLLISNAFTNRLVHKWRSEEAAILVGTRTALADNPSLTTRQWSGNNPLRILIDMELTLPAGLSLFDKTVPTLVFNRHKHTIEDLKAPGFDQCPLQYYQVTTDVSLVQQMLHALYHLNIQSLIVEGGSKTLQSFIDENAWNEARIITNTAFFSPGGVRAPELGKAKVIKTERVQDDVVNWLRNV